MGAGEASGGLSGSESVRTKGRKQVPFSRVIEGEGQSRTDRSERPSRQVWRASNEDKTTTTCNKNARGNERGSRPFLARANARKKQHMERVKRGIEGGSFTFATERGASSRARDGDGTSGSEEDGVSESGVRGERAA